MSNFVKFRGTHNGPTRSAEHHNEQKTFFLRINDIQEICDVDIDADKTNFYRKYFVETNKNEYEKNKDDPNFYTWEGNNTIIYFKKLPTAIITIGRLRDSSSILNVDVKVQMSAKDAVNLIDQADIDSTISKALAVDAARAERDASSKK